MEQERWYKMHSKLYKKSFYATNNAKTGLQTSKKNTGETR